MKKSVRLALFCLTIFFAVAAYAFPVAEDIILIPAGEFAMGSESRGSDERPVHQVYLDAYYIGKYEVTNEEYHKFWEATGHSTPESFADDYNIGAWPERAIKFPRHPVVGITWHDAAAYAKWVNMRLPTEAEWENAARGPTDRLWPWGTSPKPYANIWDGKDGYDNTIAPVGSYPDGKSYYGVMDMAGNAWEWTADWYSDTHYFHSPRRNPRCLDTGSWRVIRGGAWIDNINRCNTTFRFFFYPSLRTSFIGFRLAKTAEVESEQ